MSDFVPALTELRNASPDIVISKLHGMFSQITTMKGHQLVAAFQTLDTLAEELNLNNHRMIQRLKEAIRIQMNWLAPPEHRYREDRKRFRDTLKRDLNDPLLR